MRKPAVTRRQQIAGFAAIGLTILVMYVFASIAEWQSYEDSTKSDYLHAEMAVKAALKPNKKFTSQNQKSLQAATNQLVSNKSAACQTAWWLSWQTLLPSLEDKVKECEAAALKQKALKTQLDKVNAFLSDEHKVSNIISQLPPASTALTDKTWDATIVKWTKVNTDLANYSASKAYQPVIIILRTQTNKALSAWKGIKAADKKQDRGAYEAEYDKLDQAITGMIAAADKSDATLQTLLNDASTVANKL